MKILSVDYFHGLRAQLTVNLDEVSEWMNLKDACLKHKDVCIKEKFPVMKVEIPKISRDGEIELTRALEKANSVLEFVDASKIKGTSGLRPIVIDASEIKAPIGTILTMSEPKKIIRSGEYTTVLWKDGTKTIVKRMPGSEDSDYSAFTAALAKKVYGTNSNVERIVSMTERVKTKAEKKAEKKAKKLREKYVKPDTTEPERRE